MKILDVFGRLLAPLPIRGKGRFAELIFRAAKVTEMEVWPLRGVRVRLRAEERIERLMWAGAYEPRLVSLLKHALRPGMTFVDVGANIGFFSCLAAGLVRQGGAVHSFEPDVRCFARLRMNLAPFSNCSAVRSAVADSTGQVSYYPSDTDGEAGWGSLLTDGKRRSHVSVPAVTLDAWNEEARVQRVDAIKLDIEGSEFRALRGAARLLAYYRPLVVAELNAECLARDGHTPSDVCGALEAAGYEDFYLTSDTVFAIPRENKRALKELRPFARRQLS